MIKNKFSVKFTTERDFEEQQKYLQDVIDGLNYFYSDQKRLIEELMEQMDTVTSLDDALPIDFGLENTWYSDIWEEENEYNKILDPNNVVGPKGNGIFELLDKVLSVGDDIHNNFSQLTTYLVKWDSAETVDEAKGFCSTFRIKLRESLKFLDTQINIIKGLRKNLPSKQAVLAQQLEQNQFELDKDRMSNEGGKSMTNIQPTYEGICLGIANVSNKALRGLEQKTGSQLPLYLKTYVKIFTNAIRMMKDCDYALQEDLSTLEGQVDNLKEISRRAVHKDIRSFEDRGSQKADAKILLSTMKQYWQKAYSDFGVKGYSKRKSAAMTNVPNYRFKLGDTVKAGNRIGKVIACFKENGTGKQMYGIRFNDGSSKNLSLSDIRAY